MALLPQGANSFYRFLLFRIFRESTVNPTSPEASLLDVAAKVLGLEWDAVAGQIRPYSPLGGKSQSSDLIQREPLLRRIFRGGKIRS
jgi:hypothetical protein